MTSISLRLSRGGPSHVVTGNRSFLPWRARGAWRFCDRAAFLTCSVPEPTDQRPRGHANGFITRR